MALPSLSAVVELLKPITWFPPMWAFGCGAISSGLPAGARWPEIAAGALLAGPLVCATSQVANDWYDRHVDAINEPQRPIPSGRVPTPWPMAIALTWTGMSLAVAWLLGTTVLWATVAALILAWAYSMPPVRLKQNGWLGNTACAVSYEGLAWVTGAAVMAGGGQPDQRSITLAALYSAGAHGIMTLNDFKSVDGDARMGVRSIPVQMGVDNAALLACVFMGLPQLVVIALLLSWGQSGHALAIAGLLALQVGLMVYFLEKPKARATFFSAFGVLLYVIGMAVSAFALAAVAGAAP